MKHKEIEMSQFTTTRDAGVCFVIWIMLRNKPGSIMALENIKNSNYGFLVKLRALVSSWQKEIKPNSYNFRNKKQDQ
jgi:hypothetical protein